MMKWNFNNIKNQDNQNIVVVFLLIQKNVRSTPINIKKDWDFNHFWLINNPENKENQRINNLAIIENTVSIDNT